MARFRARALAMPFHAFFYTALLMSCAVAPVIATGQSEEDAHVPEVKGYVTAIHTPDSFEINKGEQVHTTPQTTYSWTVPAGAKSRPAAASDIDVGVYVRVSGPKERKQVTAQSILILDPSEKQVKGSGLIVTVIGTDPEPAYEADGYRIRITPATITQFSGKFKKLADIGVGDWIHYEGKRDANGELVAARAEFSEGMTGEKSAAKMKQESASPDAIPPQVRLINKDGKFIGAHQKVRMGDAGGVCGWHRLSSNSALQERVWRVGLQVVPAYQKKLPSDAKGRIRFRFYAVDDSEFRSAFGCDPGLILIPEQVVARLTTDDMLAAVLADGVAGNLQWQEAKVSPDRYMQMAGASAILAGEVAAEVASPWGILAVEGTSRIVSREMMRRLQEQSSRIALALMADAGYNPWAAPEAWRLLAPKKLPADTASLPYPDISGYQLSLLHLRYKQNEKSARAD